MSLNFPADPVANPIYEAPNGVTYIWNDSIQSWVVQSVTYDDDYVNRTGDTMTGNLNFAPNQLGIKWGGNPRIQFMTSGVAELRGRFSTTGPFECRAAINLTSNTSLIRYKDLNRFKFTSTESVLVFDDQDLLKVNASGVEYHGNFTQDKNVTTVEYVTNEIQNVQDQIDNITNDLDDIIEGIVDQKAVLLTGNQTASGHKKFSGNLTATGITGFTNGSNTNYTFKVSDSAGNRYFWVSQDGKVHVQSRETFNNTSWPNITDDTQVVNKKYADNNYLTNVVGTSGQDDDTGVRTVLDQKGVKRVYMEKASISQYGVNVRGLLPQGNSDPSNSNLKVGQMYFNTNSKRVFIRVN